MRQSPRPQEVYRHFKGNVYQIVTLARHSETDENMVVYQQLYAPYEVYVRPLEMFMSKIDTRKYPNEKQIYRFEKITVREEEIIWQENTTENQEDNSVSDTLNVSVAEVKENIEEENEGFELDPGLVEFLDADSYEKKLQILSMLHPRITDAMIDTMAVSLDTEIKEGDIEMRYNEIKNCLLTMERFECNRLR